MALLMGSTSSPADRLALVVAGLVGCYAPDVGDCTLACESESDCIDGQRCTIDGWCAASVLRCDTPVGPGVTVDAAVDAPIDAPAPVRLRVRVDGTGAVDVAGLGSCDDSECIWIVTAGTITVTARTIEDDKPFERWTTANCAGHGLTCVVQLVPDTTQVGAKFR